MTFAQLLRLLCAGCWSDKLAFSLSLQHFTAKWNVVDCSSGVIVPESVVFGFPPDGTSSSSCNNTQYSMSHLPLFMSPAIAENVERILFEILVYNFTVTS